MFGGRFNQAKCETTSRLCVGRIKLIRNKKTVQLKQSQKDIAELLKNGKQEYARIRVEGVIREKLLMQAYEILELYLELLTVRTQLLAKTKELPRDMMEAVSSIIYAAQRISDLPELATLRDLFVAKYGKEYAAEAASDAASPKWQVNSNLIRCLLVEPPQPEEKLEMLSEIAQEHGVEWDLSAAARDMGVGVGMAWAGPAGVRGLSHASIGEPAAAMAATAKAGGGAPGSPYPVIFPPPVPFAPPGVSSLNLGAQYTSVQQAAAAAAQAAAQAGVAAQFAAQMAAAAQQQQQQKQQQGSAHAATIVGNGNTNGNGPSAPEQVWQLHPATISELPPSDGAVYGLPMPPSSAFPRSTPSSPPLLSPPHADALMPEEDEAAAAAAAVAPPFVSSGGGTSSSVSSAGGYLVRSDSEIQRAYDAAQGPPSKGATAATAPPPPSSVVTPVLPPPPPPPSEKQPSPFAPPPPPLPKEEDEYEELTRRLEALKKR